MAGLWERWGEGDDALESCTIVTTEANDLMASLHDRMPVILAAENYDLWLDPRQHDRDRLEALLCPYAGDMQAKPVSKLVNNPRNESPDCIAPVPQQGQLPGM